MVDLLSLANNANKMINIICIIAMSSAASFYSYNLRIKQITYWTDAG